MTTLYSLRTHITDGDIDRYYITKFVDGEVESAYVTSLYECECPAGHRGSCRHRQMLPQMLAHGIVNTHWFWNFDTNRVVDFQGELKSNLDALNELADTTDITNAPPIRGEDLIDPFYDFGSTPIVGEAQHVEAVPDPLRQMFNELANIPGVSLHTLDNLVDLHNAIADAVGEPRAYGPIARKPWRRL